MIWMKTSKGLLNLDQLGRVVQERETVQIYAPVIATQSGAPDPKAYLIYKFASEDDAKAFYNEIAAKVGVA